MGRSETTLGDVLRDQIVLARREVVLISPFVKARTLTRLVEALRVGVKLDCVTRWRSEEIGAGVSDLEAYEVVLRHGGTLWLRQDLHAKYYRCDSFVSVGSANLTNTGLGWTTEPNLELLMPVTAEAGIATGFEESVFKGAVQVDGDLYETMTAMLAGWVKSSAAMEQRRDEVAESGLVVVDRWLPLTREPADLYQVYLDPHRGSLPKSTCEAGSRDLAALHPPKNLNEKEFSTAIGVSLMAMPMVNRIDRQLRTPQRFGAIRNVIRQRLGASESDASRRCQTLVRWLVYFLGGRYEYRRPGYTEIIGRRSVK